MTSPFRLTATPTRNANPANEPVGMTADEVAAKAHAEKEDIAFESAEQERDGDMPAPPVQTGTPEVKPFRLK